VQNVGEDDLVLQDLSKQRGVDIIIIGSGGCLAPAQLNMSLKFLPQAEFMPTIDALGESVLAVKQSIKALPLWLVVTSAVHHCSVLT